MSSETPFSRTTRKRPCRDYNALNNSIDEPLIPALTEEQSDTNSSPLSQSIPSDKPLPSKSAL